MTDLELQNIANCVVALQKLTKSSGTKTERTQGKLLQPLSPEDLTTVALLVNQMVEGGTR
jgi:hypothetical protein